MTELEKLAQWHDGQAGYSTFDHTAAAATTRAAMAENERLREAFEKEAAAHFQYRCGNVALALEIERLREALTVVRRGRHNNGRPMCRSDVRDIARAALKAPAHD